MPELVMLNKQSLLNCRYLFNNKTTDFMLPFLFLFPPQDQSFFLFRAGFSRLTTLIFSLRIFMLRIFSSISLSVFCCSCPTLLQGEFLHANETTFPTWQRFTHVNNFSCYPLAHTQAAQGGVLANKVRGKLKTVVLHNINSLVLSSSHLGDGGSGIPLCTTGLLTCILVFLSSSINQYKF